MKICPYLAKVDDPSTAILFASRFNGCHRLGKAWKPGFSIQANRCLTEAFEACATYRQEPQAVEVTRTGPRLSRWMVVAVVTLGLILVDLVVVWLLQNSASFGRSEVKSTETATTEAIRPTEMAASATATVVVTMTETMAPSGVIEAATQTPDVATRVDLDSPFGAQTKFIIHRLRAGESFFELTLKYTTTVDVLKWVNFDLHVPLWENELIVIPLKMTTIDPAMPPFEAYQVGSSAIKAHDLAEKLGVDAGQLCIYNGLKPEQVLPRQHWLIVPRTRK
jgi:hypothetical protein